MGNMSRERVSPPERAACQWYLSRCNPRWQLGEFICAGGSAVVYELLGEKTPHVVKIIDSRFMAGRSGNRAADKELRRKCMQYVETEIVVMEQLKDCRHTMPLRAHYTLNSPNGEEAGAYVSVTLLVMPKLTPLLRYITDTKALTQQDILQLGRDIGCALGACVKNGILHRDVKPENIFVYQENGKLRFVLGDFGVSRRVAQPEGQRITGIGTDYYVAPEIRYGEPLKCLNSDIYSLGVTLFYLLTNQFPQMQKDVSTGASVILETYHLPEVFLPALTKALQTEQEQRWQTPEAFLKALEGIHLSHPDSVLRDPFTTAAKDALCRGKPELALEYAMKGFRKKEKPCRRLLAYCLFRRDPSDERVLDLLDECFQQGDAAGILIRGMIYAARGDMENAVQDFRDAATGDGACVPAWYYYGRFLYDGGLPGIAKDTGLGVLYLQKAAEQGFYPALRILRRLWQSHPELDFPETLIARLQLNYDKNDPMEKADIIKYL